MGWVKNRDTVTDWGEILEGADLPRGIRPADIDGIIEIGGRFLVFEKKHPDEETKEGQEILLKQLARVPQFTVIEVVHGPDGVEEVFNYGTGERIKASPAEFISWVEGWAKRADMAPWLITGSRLE